MRAFLLALHGALALACTQILVPSPTGEVVVANTVESGDYVAEHDGHSVHLTLRGDALGGGNGTGCGADCRRRRLGVVGPVVGARRRLVVRRLLGLRFPRTGAALAVRLRRVDALIIDPGADGLRRAASL